ncbi:MAG: hypothetical protein DELT_00728 [Desulfovibrio sp.]
MRRFILLLFACLLAMSVPTPAAARPLAVTVPQSFLGISYRADGALNDQERYATFNAPDTVFNTPGLNCSGLVLAVSRKVLGTRLPIREVVRDRLGDSGPDSPLGHDWDFGFDFIMNIADGQNHALLLPVGEKMPSELTGRTAPGFDPHAAHFADDLLPRIAEGRLYLVSFSRRKTPDSPPHLHYHTGVIVRDGDAVWSYSTTHNSRRAIRINLADPQGLAKFRQSFRNTKGSYKRLTIIEVTPQ